MKTQNQFGENTIYGKSQTNYQQPCSSKHIRTSTENHAVWSMSINMSSIQQKNPYTVSTDK